MFKISNKKINNKNSLVDRIQKDFPCTPSPMYEESTDKYPNSKKYNYTDKISSRTKTDNNVGKMQNKNSVYLNNENNFSKAESSLFEKEMLYDNNNNEIQHDKKDFNLSLSRIIKNDNIISDVGTDIEESINNSNMQQSQ